MATLKPLGNNVMFSFIDETGGSKGRFHDRPTEAGIILVSSADSNKKHRWGKVVAAGPKAEVNTGDYILVEALMWMEGTSVDGVKVWKTDDSKILAVTDRIEHCSAQ